MIMNHEYNNINSPILLKLNKYNCNNNNLNTFSLKNIKFQFEDNHYLVNINRFLAAEAVSGHPHFDLIFPRLFFVQH